MVVAALATALFTPATWGTEGFAIFAPWYVALLVDPKHTGLLWPLAAFVFAVAALVNLFNGGKSPKPIALKRQ